MTEMCDPCPRIPVTHVPSRYSFKPGHPENEFRPVTQPHLKLRGTTGLNEPCQDCRGVAVRPASKRHWPGLPPTDACCDQRPCLSFCPMFGRGAGLQRLRWGERHEITAPDDINPKRERGSRNVIEEVEQSFLAHASGWCSASDPNGCRRTSP